MTTACSCIITAYFPLLHFNRMLCSVTAVFVRVYRCKDVIKSEWIKKQLLPQHTDTVFCGLCKRYCYWKEMLWLNSFSIHCQISKVDMSKSGEIKVKLKQPPTSGKFHELHHLVNQSLKWWGSSLLLSSNLIKWPQPNINWSYYHVLAVCSKTDVYFLRAVVLHCCPELLKTHQWVTLLSLDDVFLHFKEHGHC